MKLIQTVKDYLDRNIPKMKIIKPKIDNNNISIINIFLNKFYCKYQFIDL